MSAAKVKPKEKPILFSGPMVRAILEGRKTMTRRVVKLADSWDVGSNYAGECWPVRKRGNKLERMSCPYGSVGDRLWVRETWAGEWKPSIHMPRWASRITLEITGVRVERLQDISQEDCCAEGIKADLMFSWQTIEPFKQLWQSINGPDSWAANPWVWVVSFKQLED